MAGPWPSRPSLPLPAGSDFRDYPFLTSEEFAEVCHLLDRRYVGASLGPVRRRWKLYVVTALNTSSALGAEHATYVQITRPLDGDLDVGGLSADLSRFSMSGVDEEEGLMDTGLAGDSDMMEAEEADKVSCSSGCRSCSELLSE